MREPNLKIFTPDEERATIKQAMMFIDQGREEEADALLDSLPMAVGYLQVLKETVGINELINSGINLSLAVEKYGKGWLNS